MVLQAYDKNGWQKWGKFFTDLFIGTTDEADECKIQNKDVLKFRYDKKNNLLKAYANEPLIISNKALGYNLRYQLETFNYDFDRKYLFYEGYPLFIDMKGNQHQLKRWQQKRKDVYEGSEMHFMRALYRNTLTQEGFDVYRMYKEQNVEKARIKMYLKNNAMPGDSANYFNNILSQPDEKNIVYSGKLTGDSIAFGIDSVTAGLSFDNYLYVVYTKKKAAATYLRYFPQNAPNIASELNLLDKVVIAIEANGNYYPNQSLLASGYWGWSEKISTLLPFDYKYVK